LTVDQATLDEKSKDKDVNSLALEKAKSEIEASKSNNDHALLFDAKGLVLNALGAATTTALENNQINQPNALIAATIQEIKAKSTDSTKASAAEAVAFLNAYIPNPQLFLLPKKEPGKSQQGEIDELISQLRYKLVANIASQGDNSALAQQTRAALAEAQKMRGEMSYIRPASSYLRSIYTTIFSRDANGLGRENLLTKQGSPTIQLFGDTSAIGSKNKLRQIQDGIDRASWMNINTVTLNSGGATNYVIVKDDVGNWYVKAMSADPSKVINAATNLMLFNMSGRVDQNLLRMAKIQSRLDSTTDITQRKALNEEMNDAQSQSKQGGAAYETVVDRYKGRYAEGLNVDFEKLATEIKTDSPRDALTSSLSDSEYASIKEIGSVAKAPSVNYDAAKEAVKPESDSDAQNTAIRQALRALDNWRAELKKSIDEVANLNEEKVAFDKATSAVSTAIEGVTKTNANLLAALKALEEAKKPTSTGKPDTAKEENAKSEVDKKSGEFVNASKEKDKAEAALKAAKTSFDLKKATIDKAKALVDTTIKSKIIDKYVDSRLAAIKETQTGLLVLGDAMKPN
jgi:hypothetical protein